MTLKKGRFFPRSYNQPSLSATPEDFPTQVYLLSMTGTKTFMSVLEWGCINDILNFELNILL